MILHFVVNAIQCNTAMLAGELHLGSGRLCAVFRGPRVDLF